MKKKIVIALIAGMLAVSVAACGESSNENTADPGTELSTDSAETNADDSSSQETVPADETVSADDGVINFDGEDFNVTYTRHELGTDYEGKPCLYYYYTFTNNGDENTSALVTAYIQCFQNGVECESAITMDSNEFIDNYSKDLQPGNSLEVCEVFSLQDSENEVTIEASDWLSLDDNKDTQIITLQ